jgi:hypothetical protein
VSVLPDEANLAMVAAIRGGIERLRASIRNDGMSEGLFRQGTSSRNNRKHDMSIWLT